MCVTDGVAVPVMLYDTVNGLVELPGKTPTWQGNLYTITNTLCNAHHVGGYVPKDGPTPILILGQTEAFVVAIFTSPGILITICLLLLTSYYRIILYVYQSIAK